MKIIPHSGRFHADEIFAVAILKIIYPKIEIIRTRDINKFSRGDFLVDVEKKYNPKKKFFDHHQEDFKEKRKKQNSLFSCWFDLQRNF